ncbi:hypothetical protein D3C72_1927650 [compost metagenome]
MSVFPLQVSHVVLAARSFLSGLLGLTFAVAVQLLWHGPVKRLFAAQHSVQHALDPIVLEPLN